MALTLVRLRWTLTLNQWRRSPFTLVMSVLGPLYVLGMAAVAVTLLVTGLPALPDEARGATTVLAAAVVVLAWLVIPPFVTGVDATLDPHSFVLFPVPARTLIAGLVLSKLGRIPEEPGDVVEVNGWRIEVLGVKRRAIETVAVSTAEPVIDLGGENHSNGGSGTPSRGG